MPRFYGWTFAKHLIEETGDNRFLGDSCVSIFQDYKTSLGILLSWVIQFFMVSNIYMSLSVPLRTMKNITGLKTVCKYALSGQFLIGHPKFAHVRPSDEREN